MEIHELTDILAEVPEGQVKIILPSGEARFEGLLSGRGQVEEISLYPGLTLSFLNYLAPAAPCRHHEGRAVELEYCRAGRALWQLKDGENRPLAPGEAALHVPSGCGAKMRFPEGGYQGLRIAFDMDAFRPPELIHEAHIQPEAIFRRLRDSFSPLPDVERAAPILSAFYGQIRPLRLPWFKLKAQELILHLARAEYQSADAPRHSQEQIEIIRKVHAHLTDNLDKRLTIEALAKQFALNPSTLKAVFKDVYGNSIAAHIREHRMERAAALLRGSNLSMAEIARAVGYESPSRFSAEFRKAFNCLPTQYRSGR